MRVSMELFLLDNALMNLLTLGVAAALSGLRPKRWTAQLLAALGAVYALFALSAAPFLLQPVCKLLFGFVLALGLSFAGWRDYMRGLLSVLVAAMLLGGLLLLATLLLGGGIQGGVLIGTVPIRAALAGGVIALLLPRLLRGTKKGAAAAGDTVTLVVQGERTLRCRALIDSGNLVTDIATGLPVVLMTDCPCTGKGTYVPYETAEGLGVLTAYRPKRAEMEGNGGRRRINVLVAQSPRPIRGADALIGIAALPVREENAGLHFNRRNASRYQQGRERNGETQDRGVADTPLSTLGAPNAAVLCAYRREPSRAAAAGGGGALDQSPEGGRGGSENGFDRA